MVFFAISLSLKSSLGWYFPCMISIRISLLIFVDNFSSIINMRSPYHVLSLLYHTFFYLSKKPSFFYVLLKKSLAFPYKSLVL